MISACYIVKNGSKTIERSLASVIGVVDEIIIVDTGSDDDTIKKASKFGKVYEFKWTGSFADARNYSISKAAHDYILIIDADEWLETDNIKKYLQGDDIYICHQVNYVNGAEVFRVRHPRIMKKGIEYIFSAHETVNLEGRSVKETDLLIHHDGYDLSKGEAEDKSRRNLKLHLKQLETEPENPLVPFYLARCYASLEDFKNAVEFAMIALICKDLDDDYKVQLLLMLHDVFLKMENSYIAYQFLARALKLIPNQKRGRWYLSRWYHLNGDYDKSINELNKIKSIKSELTGDMNIPVSKITNNIKTLTRERNQNAYLQPRFNQG